ncbi:NADPH-dependent FMN reductase [Paenibacillus sp. GCM10027627]|uniref:NADPH-dependent FMN reductase n=1 Tax=unclassified Paenibacillus TaxID=185978 RepID=UPI0036404530
MKIVLLAGSNREGASSTKLARYMEQGLIARKVEVSFIDLRQLVLPLYSPDYVDLNDNAKRIIAEVGSADGFIFATPEYHGSISGVLKNALDYLSGNLVEGKPVLSVSSAGGPSGVCSLLHLQSIVRNLHGINCPQWVSIGYGWGGVDEKGNPVDSDVRDRVDGAIEQLLKLTRLTADGTEAESEKDEIYV